MHQRVLYLAIDVFSKGGIQRYSRAQIQALRELLGEQAVSVLVIRPRPEAHLEFEEPFAVTSVESRRGLPGQLHFIYRAIREGLSFRPGIVWTNHVMLFPLAYFIYLLCGARAVVGNVYGLELWSGLSIFERLALRRMTHIVSDSHFAANYLCEAHQIPEGRISVHWDPVDVDRFTPRRTAAEVLPRYGVPYRPEACYVMTLGRISAVSRHKGYDRMLDAVRALGRGDLVYLIVGDGDDRKRLEQRVADEGLTGHVYFLGNIPEPDLVNVYNTADIFALVSDRGPGRGEGVPLTVLEAASCGVPIIVGNEDGAQEAVENGVNGFIVSPRDNAAIQSVIASLLDEPGRRQAMAEAARERVERYFAYPSFRAKTRDVLSKLEYSA